MDNSVLMKGRVKGRVTVVETVCHQQFGEQPVVIDTRYSKQLSNSDQAYIRKYKIGEEWKLLDTGWVEEASLLVIRNDPEPMLLQPTDEEKEIATRRVLEVRTRIGVGEADWIIPPGELLQGTPNSLKSIEIRCQCGEARCTIGVFPK